MIIDVNKLDAGTLKAACQQFDALGYVQLSGLGRGVAPAFEAELAEAISMSRSEFQRLLDPRAGAEIFDRDVRRRLSKIATTTRLSDTLLASLSPLLRALIGPMVHVSSTYHSQFKGGPVPEAAKDIVHYHNQGRADYMEVHGAYRMHQDFTGASLPTSPSGLTLWVALNDCEESTLRVFPGSHRIGLYCHRMWRAEDPRLDQLAPPVELEARAGTGVIFNALLFHGTGRLGDQRRVSCDLRFFPLAGFLPSEVHFLDNDPIESIEQLRAEAPGETILAPLLEQLAFLGEDVRVSRPYPLSRMHWVNYLVDLVAGRPDAALPHFENFINTDLLEDPPSVFVQKFHNRDIHRARLELIRERAAGRAGARAASSAG